MHKVVLVDMDGVLADFEGMVLESIKRDLPDIEPIPFKKRKNFYVDQDYEERKLEDGNRVGVLMLQPNFFRNMKPIDGAIAGINKLNADKDLKVFICTAPMRHYQNCVLEKYDWVKKHLGAKWINRLILTRDKSLIKGDVLIDDRPQIIGDTVTPSWKHIVFDAPYNQNVSNPRMKSWNDLDVIYDELKKK